MGNKHTALLLGINAAFTHRTAFFYFKELTQTMVI
jgi:hypothetical protein